MNRSRHIRHAVAFLPVGIALAAGLVAAQTPAPASGPILSFSATTENVSGAPDSIRIDLFRWSTDAEREKLMSAWNMTSTGRGGRGRGAGAGRGGRGGGGRGAAGDDPAPDPDAVEDPFGAFRGAGRGGPSGGGAPPPTPESTLATALKQATTVGYLWSSEVAGYALRYAGKVTGPDGNERIILITSRRLGTTNDLWKPAGAGNPAPFDFSVVELRVNSKGEGEGKVSVTGKVAPDAAAKIVAVENYATLPVVLKNVKRRN
jgi:hypothetical protein